MFLECGHECVVTRPPVRLCLKCLRRQIRTDTPSALVSIHEERGREDNERDLEADTGCSPEMLLFLDERDGSTLELSWDPRFRRR